MSHDFRVSGLGLVFMGVLLGTVASAEGPSPLTITEYRGTQVLFPAGQISFADAVVAVTQGSPAPTTLKRPTSALGPPDWDIPDAVSRQMTEYPDKAYTLGCGGSVTFAFTDNALIDVPGPDLYIFEVGIVERTQLQVSNDLLRWTDIGSIGGALVEVDLANFDLQDEIFRYVRLEDLRSDCRLPTPGADIDAIGAIGSAQRLSFSATTLFDVGSDRLRDAAIKDLERAAEQIDAQQFQRILVVGHTDATGAAESNEALGLGRALAVRQRLIELAPTLVDLIDARSKGETEPIADNDTSEGRALNRRVEIVLIK